MIRIDEEFKNLIQPLTDDEFKGLEESILKEGCRDKLVMWGNTLIDGHNRYQICQKHNIKFETVQKDFASRDDVMLWMIDTQFNRRNLEAPDRILLAQKKAPILERLAREKQLKTLKQNSENRFVQMDKTEKEEIAFVQMDKSYHEKTEKTIQPTISHVSKPEPKQTIQPVKPIQKPVPKEQPKPIHVREEVAKIAGVSSGTVARFEQVQKKKPEMIEAIRKGEVSINQAYNAVKAEEKKETILKAERKIAEQAKEQLKPILHIGDGTKHNPAEKYDLLLTDPPYSTDVDNISEFVKSWLYHALNNVKPTGFAYVFIGAYPEELKAYLNAEIPEHIKLCQQLVWTYKNTLGNNPKDRYKQNYQVCLFYRGINAPDLDCPLTSEQWAVQEINAPDGRQGDRYHAWQKPMEIAERFIRHSTKQGFTVFDPFSCTGTFLLAAAKLGRKAYGFEINPDNAKIAFERGCVNAE